MDIKRCNTETLCMLLVLVSIYSLESGNGEAIRCIEKERQALLKFKQEVTDQYNVLSLWGTGENISECCSWQGIVCSNMTGRVIVVELPRYYSYMRCRNGLVIHNLDWLSDLSSLFLLDFGCSSFTPSLETVMFRIISTIPSLKKLRLRMCHFPNDTSSINVYANSTSASLSNLDLSGVGLAASAFHWLFNISTSLVSIDLSHNKLDGPIPDAFGQKFVFLEYLDLSYNRFEGGIPISFQNLRILKYLRISDNNLTEPLPEFIGTIVSMKVLDLSDNQITGSLPESVWELPKLEYLSVSYNSLEGEISESHLSNLHNLKILDLSRNSLILNLTPDWIPPFHLDGLELAGLNLGPRFPAWVHTQSNVSYLGLSDTNLSDELPETFWDSFPRLVFLNLSHNHISGELPDLSSKLSGSQGPSVLDLSFNEFSGSLPSFGPDTRELSLSNNKFVGTILFVCKSNLLFLVVLDLSNNQLSGQLPNCWERIGLNILNLSNNSFSGKIPNYMGLELLTLRLGNNNFSGELPSGLSKSRSLTILDVGGNKLTGNIPTWIGTNLGSLMILNTRGNNFFGSIPPEICQLTQIQVLDLSKNNLSGRIPLHCFDNFTNLVHKSSEMVSEAASYVFSLAQVIRYQSIAKVVVQWKGRESELDYGDMLPLIRLIDLSSNRLEGNIPTEVFKMKRLNSLNLSRNHLTGNINPEIHMMESLECLDLSNNQLSGEIPASLGTLSLLNNLDLSNNNLSGKIPSGTQLQSFDAWRYAGNNGLCGPPLQSCPKPYTSSIPRGTLDRGSENDDAFTYQSLLKELYMAIVFGFIVGFWGTIGALLLKTSWRYAYFNFFDNLCLKAAIYMRRSR